MTATPNEPNVRPDVTQDPQEPNPPSPTEPAEADSDTSPD
jgi:hypothetical protein